MGICRTIEPDGRAWRLLRCNHAALDPVIQIIALARQLTIGPPTQVGIETNRPTEGGDQAHEEGSRFAAAMILSGVFAGVFDLEYGLPREDNAGVTGA